MEPGPQRTKREQNRIWRSAGRPREHRSKDQLLNAERQETQRLGHFVRVILMTSAPRVRVMTLGNVSVGRSPCGGALLPNGSLFAGVSFRLWVPAGCRARFLSRHGINHAAGCRFHRAFSPHDTSSPWDFRALSRGLSYRHWKLEQLAVFVWRQPL